MGIYSLHVEAQLLKLNFEESRNKSKSWDRVGFARTPITKKVSFQNTR
jgi:hypothetical protein